MLPVSDVFARLVFLGVTLMNSYYRYTKLATKSEITRHPSNAALTVKAVFLFLLTLLDAETLSARSILIFGIHIRNPIPASQYLIGTNNKVS